jgi:hypothetical protein
MSHETPSKKTTARRTVLETVPRPTAISVVLAFKLLLYRVSGRVGLFPRLDIDDIVQFLVLKEWLVNFFIFEILRTNITQFFV